MLIAHAYIEMQLGYIDTGVGSTDATHYPTLCMHVHDRQLFGLRGWMKGVNALTECSRSNSRLQGEAGLAH